MSRQKELKTNLQGKPSKKSSDHFDKPGTLIEIMDRALGKHHSWLIWVFPGIALIFSLLLFDSKVSMSGDDASYINRAYDFIHSFKYPVFQGPLYPMVLGLLVIMVGVQLVPMKLLSLVALISALFLLYKFLKDRIPATILVATMAVISLNSYLLYYSSQTYSEAFYILIQTLVMIVFFRYFIDVKNHEGMKQEVKRHLLLALCLLCLTLTRSIGYSALAAVFGYFILMRQWKNFLYAIIAFALLFITYQGLKYLLWQDAGIQFSTQGNSLMNKDYYNPQDGKEDIAGMLKRLWDNSNLYLSKHFMYMVGYRTFVVGMPVLPLITVLVYALAFAGLAFGFLRNRHIFFTGLLTGSFLLVTFIVLQAKWDQNRLIIPVFPLIILLLLSAFYYLTSLKKLRFFQFIIPLLVVISFFRTFADSVQKIKDLRADSGRFGGLTMDWKNYLKASEWAAENLPPDAITACRKPSISFVYGKGRSFYGIMQLPTFDPDVLLKMWKEKPENFVAYSYKDFAGKNLSQEQFQDLKKYMLAQIVTGENFYFVDRMPDSIRNRIRSDLKAMNIPEIIQPDSLAGIIASNQKAAVLIYPDSLLNTLYQNKVTHVLTASLRRNTMVNNGQIINTVERYIAFIEDKYPGITTKLSQVGADDNEPAAVFQINYEKAGLKRPGKVNNEKK